MQFGALWYILAISNNTSVRLQESPNHWFFHFWGFYRVLGSIGFFGFFYLSKQLGSLLVDLPH